MGLLEVYALGKLIQFWVQFIHSWKGVQYFCVVSYVFCKRLAEPVSPFYLFVFFFAFKPLFLYSCYVKDVKLFAYFEQVSFLKVFYAFFVKPFQILFRHF